MSVYWNEVIMQPFSVSSALKSFKDTYPSAEDIVNAVWKGRIEDRLAIARLWLSEGIPFAFQAQPALYEIIRSWLASRLAIDPKEVTLIGSGRQGQSMSPDHDFGRPFGLHSDLDIGAVSSNLFEKLRNVFHSWADDYESGVVVPSNPREKKFWDGNLSLCPNTVIRGFIDADKIPRLDRYPIVQTIGQAMFLLPGKLRCTVGAPDVKKATFRVYRDWGAFARQLAFNLEIIARKRVSSSANNVIGT
jgi:hypothetical protein